MDLNKYTKAELISKIKNQKSNSTTTSRPTVIEFILYMKNWILSFTIIALLMNIFKKYKSIRAVLRLANYAIVTIFGISMFEAFGFGFLVKFLAELKYVFGSVVAYLTDNTFYNYLMSFFKVTEERKSVRDTYKRPIDSSWNEELVKQQRSKAMQEWLDRQEAIRKKSESNYNNLYWILLILLLAGRTWYYGEDIVRWGAPIWEAFNSIRNFRRGGNADDEPQGKSMDITKYIDKDRNNPKITFSEKAEKWKNDMINWIHEAKDGGTPKSAFQSAKLMEDRLNKLGDEFPREYGLWPKDTENTVIAQKFLDELNIVETKYTTAYGPINQFKVQNNHDLDSDSDRSISPDMLVYSSDTVKASSTNAPIAGPSNSNTIPPIPETSYGPPAPLAPPAPPAPPAPSAPPATDDGVSFVKKSGFLNEITKGKSLKSVKPEDQNIRDEVNLNKQPVSGSLADALSTKFKGLRAAVTGEKQDAEIDDTPKRDFWEDSSIKINKGKEKAIESEDIEVDSPRSDKAVLGIIEDTPKKPITHFKEYLQERMITEDMKEHFSKINKLPKDLLNKFNDLSETFSEFEGDLFFSEVKKIIPDLTEEMYSDYLYCNNLDKLNKIKDPEKYAEALAKLQKCDLIEIQNTGSNRSKTNIDKIMLENFTQKGITTDIEARLRAGFTNRSSESIDNILAIRKKTSRWRT
jgi:hypothetical protein